MKKLTSISQKMDTFIKVMQKLMIIGLAVAVLVTAILTVVNVINPNAVIGENFNVVDIGPITVELAQELGADNRTILVYVWIVLALGAMSAAFIYYALGLIRKILKPMTEGSPFDFSVGHNIKKIAYVALVLGVVQNLGSIIETAVTVKAFDLAALPDSGAVQSITANYVLDLNFLLVFFVLLLMSHIFNYGAELQQLSDETL